MDENKIGEIVRKVFEKAKKEHASHSRFALSNHIGDHIGLSSRTLERVYDRYILRKENANPPNADTVERLCTYLGFTGYKDYVEKNLTTQKKAGRDKSEDLRPNAGNGKNGKKIIIISTIGLILLIFGIWVITDHSISNSSEYGCMAWADSLYVPVSCDTGPYSKFGTKVEPLDPVRLKSFKKKEVHAAYPFFTEDEKALVWYYKNKEGEIEYFTSPGLHPVNGETLRKITPYIIQTYVPKHRDRKDSFVQ